MSKMELYNADCFEILKNLADDSIDMILTDPPYKMHFGETRTEQLGERLNKRRKEMLDKNLTEFGAEQINKLVEQFKRIQKRTNVFVFCSKDQIRDWYNAYPELNPYVLFWAKTNPPPTFNNTLLPDVEYILWFREKGTPCNTTYKNASRYDVTAINQKDKKKFHHPTCKPVRILKRYIEIATNPDDVVLDCFMGSGATGVACRELGRNFIGIEIDKEYYETAKKRIEQ